MVVAVAAAGVPPEQAVAPSRRLEVEAVQHAGAGAAIQQAKGFGMKLEEEEASQSGS
jgi:hypothetical protein